MMKSTTLLILSSLILCTNAVISQLYVDIDATGSNNGTNWTDAYTDLNDALNSAISGDTIWVADGMYVPGTTNIDVFTITSDISIFGGFNGTETSVNQRDIISNQTIISGDIGVIGDPTDNSDNLISANNLISAALIDGFILELTYSGSAITLDDAEIILRNSTIRNNRGPQGAGIYSLNSDLTVINCKIHNNLQTSGGGTVYTNGGVTLFYNTLFFENAGSGGAACFAYSGGEQSLVNCTVVGNQATLFANAGAVATSNNAFTYVSNSIIWGNHYQNDSNEVSQISNYSPTGTTVISHSIVQNYTDMGDITGVSISAANPLFVDIADVNMLQLMAGSPAIDTGRNDSIPLDITDLDLDGDVAEYLPFALGGNNRIISSLVDLGAYEYQPVFQSIYEYSQNIQAKLYPTISSGPVTLELMLDKPENVVITIYDVSGKLVRKPIYHLASIGKNTLTIPKENLSGHFYVVITSSTGRKSKPVFFVEG